MNEQLISDSRIFHFGSLSMTGEICEAATKKAVNAAKKNGLMISFDPNLRVNMWDSLDKAKEKIEYGIAIDAKSIMGIFSLDLSKPLELRIISEDENEIADVLDKIGRFIVSE